MSRRAAIIHNKRRRALTYLGKHPSLLKSVMGRAGVTTLEAYVATLVEKDYANVTRGVAEAEDYLRRSQSLAGAAYHKNRRNSFLFEGVAAVPAAFAAANRRASRNRIETYRDEADSLEFAKRFLLHRDLGETLDGAASAALGIRELEESFFPKAYGNGIIGGFPN
jgi:hypothetical protein